MVALGVGILIAWIVVVEVGCELLWRFLIWCDELRDGE